MTMPASQLVPALKAVAQQGLDKGEPASVTIAAITAVVRRERPNLPASFASSYASSVYLAVANNKGNLLADTARQAIGSPGASFAQGVSDILGGFGGGWTGLVKRIAVGAFGVVLLAIGLISLTKDQTVGAATRALGAKVSTAASTGGTPARPDTAAA